MVYLCMYEDACECMRVVERQGTEFLRAEKSNSRGCFCALSLYLHKTVQAYVSISASMRRLLGQMGG